MTTDRTFAIVGASLAGAKAAETLRTEGFDGRIVLVGSETEHPYERPPLSKDFLSADVARDVLHVHCSEFYADQNIELWLGQTVQELDRAAQELVLDDGARLRYDRVLLATGSASRRLRIPGAGLDGLLYLRSVEDAERLRSRLHPGSSVVVVGAGWIGAEVAASARQRGLDVTVLDPAAVPLEHVMGPEVGAVYRDVHADHGVRMIMGNRVEAFEGHEAVERVRTSDGQVLPCDFVVVGVGALPRTALGARAGLAADDGILVDEHRQTSDPHVFAAGDVANAFHPFYGRHIRVGHWANALNQGPVAARSMLGAPAIYDRIPYFFSDQYDVGMEYVGYAQGSDRVVFRGDPASREFMAFWMAHDRVVAGMNVNTWDVSDTVAALIRARVAVDDRDLADPDLPLTTLTSRPEGQVA
jgi:3-phenylpropionate/trans-cinnamate dioxygenase ferredoxin reductase component